LLKKINLLLLIMIICVSFFACRQVQIDELEKEPEIKVELENGDIKEIGLESYVEGVVAAEMEEGWPENAYAAQAIKARTFALKWFEEHDKDFISAKHEETQAYNPKAIKPQIKEGVDKTRGEVVKYEGEYINAWFHASAAGQTTSAQVGLAYDDEEPAYITSVDSPDELAPEDIQNWQVELSQEEIISALEQTGEEPSAIEDIEIISRDQTDRIIDIKFTYPEGSKELRGAEFRTLVGPDELKSILIREIKEVEDGFEFYGSGWGHGVGMSQWGANKLAQGGKSPEEIINYYFKDVEIVKLWE